MHPPIMRNRYTQHKEETCGAAGNIWGSYMLRTRRDFYASRPEILDTAIGRAR
jgi:hypothetical protein